jgi:hypothetical protein
MLNETENMTMVNWKWWGRKPSQRILMYYTGIHQAGSWKTTKNPIHDKQPRLQPPEYKSYSFVHQIMAHTGNDYTTLHDF